MQFQLPQFIEYETKIVGPLTFKQFMFFGIAGAFLFVLYFMLPLSNFLAIAIFIGGGTFVLVFGKTNGRPLLIVLKNFLTFTASNKLYLWKRKKTFVSFKPREGKRSLIPETEKKQELPLKIAEKSRLKKIRSRLEIS
ncbi:hypothetical protein AMJ49_04805 [Parcubacteria bacterium DG_74_2]|nr:MAG: hypothetical protein AMJ49_04805 [Parcubacteria bacterium DG_74_2]